MAVTSGSSQPFRVIVAGGSYGGLAAAVHLLDHCSGAKAKTKTTQATTEELQPGQCQSQPQHTLSPVPVDITIVDERDGFYHTIGTPLVFCHESFASKAWVKFQDIPALKGQNVHSLQGTVSSVDPAAKVATIVDSDTKTSRKLAYDFFVGATGLRREWPSVPRSLRRKNYIFEAESQIAAMASTAAHGGVVFVGGGAVGIEMSTELKVHMPNLPVTLVHSRDSLLSAEPLPEEFKLKALELVRECGVEVKLGMRLKGSRPLTPPARDTATAISKANGGIVGPVGAGVELEFEDGTTMKAGEVVMAVSKSFPSTAYFPEQALDHEKYAVVLPDLSVDPTTGLPNAGDHFVAGDAAKWSGIKRCGTAMYMGLFVANNIFRLMLARTGRQEDELPELLELDEIPPMMGVAVGKQGVSYWPGAGTTAGEQVLKDLFGEDMGFTVCWNHMMLGAAH